MKISKTPMALAEGEPPWYHQIHLEDGKWVERWVQYEEGEMTEEDDEYDHCYECSGLGGDYIINDDGELECYCDRCGCNPDLKDGEQE